MSDHTEAVGNYLPSTAPHEHPISQETIERLGPAAVKAYVRLADILNLSEEERAQLSGITDGTALPDAASLTQDQLYRISYLLGIWKGCAGTFGTSFAISWLTNTRTGGPYVGQRLISYMIDGGLDAFYEIRREADYWAYNGW